ncbi:MAG: ATP-binding protein [Microbacteriaceae bacterium]
MLIDSASDRVWRILAISIGFGSVIFSLLGVPAILDQSASLVPAYTIATVVIFCGIPPLMALVARRLPVRDLRVLAGVHAASGLILVPLWVPAMTVSSLPVESFPWIINMAAVGMTTAAVALPPLATWVYVVIMSAICGVVRFLVYGGGDGLLAFQDTIMAALFGAVMVSLVQLGLRAGKEQDAAALIAQEAAAIAASAETAHRQRAMYDAFTHDDVLATLLAAARGGATTAVEASNSARRALNKLDTFSSETDTRASLAPEELESLLISSASSVGLRIVVRYRETPAEAIHAPLEVCHALAEALAEALRNSVTHAGANEDSPVRRDAVALIGKAGVRVEVSDDGRGFDPRRIGLDRLGVRVSILRRLNSMAGGRAVIRSARGSGTTVILEWNDPGGDRED